MASRTASCRSSLGRSTSSSDASAPLGRAIFSVSGKRAGRVISGNLPEPAGTRNRVDGRKREWDGAGAAAAKADGDNSVRRPRSLWSESLAATQATTSPQLPPASSKRKRWRATAYGPRGVAAPHTGHRSGAPGTISRHPTPHCVSIRRPCGASFRRNRQIATAELFPAPCTSRSRCTGCVAFSSVRRTAPSVCVSRVTPASLRSSRRSTSKNTGPIHMP